MNSPSPARRPGQRPGRRPAKPPRQRAAHPQAQRIAGPRGGRPDPAPVPLERGRAAGVLGGLAAFTAGFAAAGAFVLAGLGSTPGYMIALTVGLVGVGLTGFFYHRGNVRLPEAKIWSPALLRAVITPLGLPVVPVVAALYVLAAVGVVGNLLIPVIGRR